MLQRRLAPLAAFLLASILLAAPAALGQERLTLEAIHASPKYGGASFQGGRWASEGPVVLYVDAKADGTTDLVSYNLETDARETLIEGANLQAADAGKRIGIEEYAYSGDGSKVLLFADTSPVWRNNTQGFYYVYDRAARRLTPVSDRAKGTQLFAKFNPAGTHVGFVRGRNVYVRDLATGQERALTTDGADGAVINGTTDWVYEEEFGLRDAWQWSPDGRHIAFLKLDEAKENTFEMADNRGFYPEVTRFKYPKAGSPNAEIQLGVADVSTGVVTYFDTDTWYKGGDAHEYLPQFGWTPEVGGRRQVWLFRMNRDQNVLDLMYADPSNGTVRTVLTERSPSWLEVETGFTDLTGGNLTYLADNLHFIWVSERDGYRHLYLYRNDGTLVRQLTDGDWDVTGFLGADEGLGFVYFVAAKESPVERHVYRQAVSFAGEAAAPARGRRGRARGATTGATTIAEPTRITQESGWHSADLSRDRRYFIDTYSSFAQPAITTLRRVDGTVVKTLEGNEAVRTTLQNTRLPRVEFTTVPGARSGDRLNAYVLRPSNFDASKKYPVLMYVYGGPGSQTVMNQWGGSRALWHMYLAEELGIVVVSVDGRGTGARGAAFKTATYRNLGRLEADDQIAAARYIGGQPWADPARLGIWGWSYGGYATLMSMLSGDGPSTFKVGLSVAPVTDWKQYDTIYTERFMSTPAANPDGYRASAPTTYANRLADRQKLLVVHGDLDDNVHFQNTIQMVDALQKAGEQFDLMVYPGKNHGIAGGRTRLHLYTLLTDYLREHL